MKTPCKSQHITVINDADEIIIVQSSIKTVLNCGVKDLVFSEELGID